MSFLTSWRNSAKPLDAQFSAYLKEKFDLDASETSKWMLVYGSTMLASRKVKLFRVYDPALLTGDKNVNYDSLAALPAAVKFQGAMSSNGEVGQFNDVRAAAANQAI
jgi:hypothetical protein